MLRLFLLFLLELTAGLLDDVRYLDVHLVSFFLQSLVLAELTAYGRHVLIGNLAVGVGLDIDANLVEIAHKLVKADIELSYYLVKSDFSHYVNPRILLLIF